MEGYLSDVTRRRMAVLLLVALVILIVLAVTDTGPFSDPPTQEELAQDAVIEFFDAARASDSDRMCELLTPEAQDQVFQSVTASLPPQEELGGCREALDRLLDSDAGKSLAQTRVAKVNDSRVSATHAVVDAELAFPGAKQREARTFQLVLVNDQWRIAGGIS